MLTLTIQKIRQQPLVFVAYWLAVGFVGGGALYPAAGSGLYPLLTDSVVLIALQQLWAAAFCSRLGADLRTLRAWHFPVGAGRRLRLYVLLGAVLPATLLGIGLEVIHLIMDHQTLRLEHSLSFLMLIALQLIHGWW